MSRRWYNRAFYELSILEKYCVILAIDLSTKHALNTNSRAILQITFTGNLQLYDSAALQSCSTLQKKQRISQESLIKYHGVSYIINIENT